MFCSVELAARIEAAERDLVATACERMRPRLREPLLVPFGGGFVAWTEPGSPMNKAVGLGFAPFDEGAWSAIEAEHARRGAALQVELSTLAEPGVARFLTGRGFRMVGVENVSGLALRGGFARDVTDADGIAIERCEAEEAEAWLEVVVHGFAAPDREGVPSHDAIEAFDRDVLARILRDFAAAEGVQLFVARRGGELAGAGSMRVGGEVAQLCGAATLPAHRRRGVQTALLVHRLQHAVRAGCELAVVTTQPGSRSQQNMQRAGFALLHARNVLVLEPPGAAAATP